MFERFLHQTPFFRLLVPFILGIVFQVKVAFLTGLNLYALIILFALAILMALSRLTQNFALNKAWGVVISLLLFSLGVQLVILKQQKETYFKNTKQTFIATAIEPPEEKENSVKTTLRLDYLKGSSQWKAQQSLLLCYFQKDSTTLKLELGNQIIAQSYLNKIKHTGNPYAFNYKKYLKFNEIYNQCYIKANQYKIIAHNKGPWIKLISNKTRQRLLNIYKSNNIKGDEFAVLSALTLGYKNELTPELKESFSTSGAMHVLAVSGLHVGIIYIILCKLLFFLQKNRYGKYLQSLIIIATLFFYAFLTGLSDSVFRATIMFTFISIGKMFTRQVNIYNSIAASAFILLIMNPYSLMSVGFQLSYAAVISIVFFQPKIYSALNFKHQIPDYIWQLISVAIAAQIGTFPITIHYFGQFPLYFIFTNIIIIPLATLIIYGAFFLFIFSSSSLLSHYISKIIYALTLFLNRSTRLIETLPYSKIDQLLVDNNEVFILMATVAILSFFIITQRLKYLRLFLFLLLVLPSYNILISTINSHKSLITIHHISGMSAIQCINGNKAYLLCGQEIDTNDTNIIYNIKPIWQRLKIGRDNVKIKQLNEPLNYFTFKQKRFVHLKNNALAGNITTKRLAVDYVILSENTDISIIELKKYFDFRMVIFDTSNSYYTAKIWEEECKKNNVSYYNVLDSGAFIKYL